jgi:sterol desaturase/sphingolipid hydroxylase (fatty acid hydroxylase superfamily)
VRLLPFYNPFLLINIIFLVIVVGDYFYDINQGRKRSSRELLVNILNNLIAIVLYFALLSDNMTAGFSLAARLRWWAPFESSWFVFVACFFLCDLIYYWSHRLIHYVPILWSRHVVHHNSSEFNLSTSLRVAWFDVAMIWIYYAPLVWLGFPVGMIIFCINFTFVMQMFLHASSVPKLGWLELVFNTPSNHRVHHAMNPCYKGKNLGGVFIFWDKMFGTYQEEVEQPVYTGPENGIFGNAFSLNLIPVLDLITFAFSKRSAKVFLFPEKDNLDQLEKTKK